MGLAISSKSAAQIAALAAAANDQAEYASGNSAAPSVEKTEVDLTEEFCNDHVPLLGFISSVDWLTDEKGNLVNNIANVLTALKNDPALSDAIAFDEMMQAVFLMRALPSAVVDSQSFMPRPLNDDDVTRIQEYLQHTVLRRVGKDVVHQAVDARAKECRFHPVRNYLNSLGWDGAARIASWLTKYLGAKSTPYTVGVGIMFFVSMVARVFEPGCQADYMPILEGPQGARKSTACRVIGGKWFSDALPDSTTGKDVSQHLRGKLLLEIAEMSVLSKAESAQLKAFLTRTHERYRPPYGRKEVHEPRQCVFIGTTNKSTYLRDETGGRRFWPIRVGNIDIDALRKDRDQLFAEAVKMYWEGAKWHPDAEFERQHIHAEQEARFEADLWEGRIREHLELNKPERVSVPQLLDVLEVSLAGRNRAHSNRVVAILDHLGCPRLNKNSKGYMTWGLPATDNTDSTDDYSGSPAALIVGTPAGQ